MRRFTTKPGPPPTSCHTCRRRRKKCDMARPCCKRCVNGGYECLGYEDRQPRVILPRKKPAILVPSQSQPNFIPADGVISEILSSPSTGFIENWRNAPGASMSNIVRPSIVGAAALHRLSVSALTKSNDATGGSSEDFDLLWPQNQSQAVALSYSPTRRSVSVGRPFNATSDVTRVENDLIGAMEAACRYIPPSVDIHITREDRFARVASEYMFQRLSFWLVAPSPAIHDSMMTKLRGSNRKMRALYLAAKLLQTPGQDPRARDLVAQGHVGWIDGPGNKFITSSCSNPSLKDIEESLMAHLELATLKFTLSDTTTGYTAFRNSLPKFLQLAAANSDLLIEQPNGNLVISFPRALIAPQFELSRFALYDVISAFLLGLPTLVEYGHDDQCDSRYHGFEWIHGIPAAFLQTISQVNSWRTGSRVNLDHWQVLEQRVLDWRSTLTPSDKISTPENVGVAQAVIQEGWRHVLLIYIYMVRFPLSSIF
ncbi:unnamed protein product [Rhizoctonia solani]|uniref:Zn(2)-C6 fungal-type domain-containing protein n=1 Tax=Rhizoctonia solani TaxID=456999 RepID=A0A8H2WHQ5_9AGAM|nr:unnamed protein product [Rhizoctonia solani]